MPSRRLALALFASVLLHLAVLGFGSLKALLKPPAPRALKATLRLPAPPPADEPLEKNTLDREDEKPVTAPKPAPPPAVKPSARPAQADKRQVQAAQRKIAEHTRYPPEAIARGIEGEVRLLLVLNDDGSLADVQIAASSGHAILDNAAIRAAYSMGRLSGVTARQMILPIRFQLR